MLSLELFLLSSLIIPSAELFLSSLSSALLFYVSTMYSLVFIFVVTLKVALGNSQEALEKLESLFESFLAPTGAQGVKMCVRACVRPAHSSNNDV